MPLDILNIFYQLCVCISSRDVKQIDGLKVPGRRRASFFQRLRYGGTATYKRHPSMPQAKMKRETTTKLRRDNSFHVSSTGHNSKSGTFSWAKMSTAGTSEEDRLSTISSKDGSEEVKRKQSVYKRDFGCQTGTELLSSIMNMPYLTRKKSQRIQRTAAIDEDYASVKFSPNNSMKVRYGRRLPSECRQNSDCRQRKSSGANSANQNECRTFLFPGYSDSPLSTSDDIENEEDFEYYDSISDLLKAHKITPNYNNDLTPICLNDKSMSTYLNPLGNNRRAISDSVESETDKTNSVDVSTPVSEKQGDAVLLVVENTNSGNISTTSTKDSNGASFSFIKSNGTECQTSAIISQPKDPSQRHSVCTEVPKINAFQNSVCAKRRSSSPLFTFTSLHSTIHNISDNDTKQRRPSALSQGATYPTHEGNDVISTNDLSALSSVSQKSSTDETTIEFVKDCDKEDQSMLEFQNFFRERGVELDMTCIESSEV